MRRYVWLLLVGVLASVAGLFFMQQMRSAVLATEAPAAAPSTALALVMGSSGLEPELASVPKDHQVVLEVRNDRTTTVTLVLQGYDDRFVAGPIAPGATWRGTFLADRPGEAFPWTVDGVGVGRFAVTGSHLMEGHR